TADRQRRDDWELAGSLDMREQARRKVRDILKNHKPMPIPPEADKAIRERFEIVVPKLKDWGLEIRD
ncbi:MAG: trimethylamine methyltransferase family protein, partial [Anaerolineales bacterium]|nr:trimethylamine methyltransferase family protein [Anaerolineales bacterium]